MDHARVTKGSQQGKEQEPGKQRFRGQQDASLPSQVEQLYRMVLPPAGDNGRSAGKRSHGLLPPDILRQLPRRLRGYFFYLRQAGAQRAEMKDKQEWLTCSVMAHSATNPRHPLSAFPVNTFPGVLGDLGLLKPLPV